MYRPKGWEETRVGDARIRYLGTVERRAVEAGADAMFEGLKKQGISDEAGFAYDYWDDNIHAEGSQQGKGYLVFIPEEEKE